LKERLPLIPRAPRSHASAAIKEYEGKLVELENAMADIDADRVQRIVAELNSLSMHMDDEQSVGAYLEKGRFSWAARQRLRKEYMDRYVLLRGGGGGPSREQQPSQYSQGDYAGARYTNMQAGDVWARADSKGSGPEILSGVTEAEVRDGFIRKVYSILSLQLVVTAIVAALVMYLTDKLFPENQTTGLLLLVAATITLLVTVCSFACNSDLARSYPTNYIILGIMTLAMAVVVGFSSSQYTSGSVLVVAILTAFLVIGLTCIAAYSCVDFTGWGPYLASALLVILGMSFLLVGASIFGFGDSESLGSIRLVLSALTAILFSFYIIYDTQLIIGGKHENQFSVDEYVVAVISLYLDIMNVFLSLLDVLGERK
jgi:FtsH-binding integral membrane protein